MLATDPADDINQLTGILNATNTVTTWVGTLLNTVIPPMDPQPAWYNSINTALQLSQQHSLAWRNTTSPNIIADMTNSFIDYAGNFAAVVEYAKPLVATIIKQGNTPTAAQVLELTQMFSSLQVTAAQNQQNLQTLLGQMQAYRTEMQSDYAALQTAIKAALPQEAADKAAVQQIQTQIQSIEVTLAADTSSATAASVDTQSAMTSLVIGLTFAAEFDPVAFGIALIFIGVDIAIDAETQAQVISDLKQIQTLSGQLNSDQVQLGLVQGVISNMEHLYDGIVSALDSFDDFDDTWMIANLSLNYLLVVLAQPQIDISKIPDLNDLDDAVIAWQAMAAFATNVQLSTLTPQTPIIISQ